MGSGARIAAIGCFVAIALAAASAQAQSCGHAGQRACCFLETSFGACTDGTIYVPQSNSGLCGGFNPAGIQSDGVCVAPTPCGGLGERACCVGESDFGACVSPYQEIPQANSGYCTNSTLGIQSSGVCTQITACGGAGQRACCVTESANACQGGLTQFSAPDSGQCGNAAPGIQSSGICIAVAPCGGAGQRACCLFEAAFGACVDGLAEVSQPNAGQCGNSALGIQSSSTCQATTPCGGTDQRACCAGEEPFGACLGGRVQVPQANAGLCANALPGTQSSGVCRALTACGGTGQRACCAGEAAFGACVDGLAEVAQPNAGYCGNSTLGIQSSSVCQATTPCGGTDQRACCAGEEPFGACQAGRVQVPQANAGLCANALPGTQSSGVCRAVTACGGSGQRACCAGEAAFGACVDGLAEVAQPNAGYCGNSTLGIQSSSVCQATTPCGGEGQRACCFGEEGFGACQAGLTQVPQPNSGLCANALPGTQSSGVCTVVAACGGAGQRACCLFEAAFGACQDGLAEVEQPNAGQCGNGPPGIQSSSVCEAVTRCGGKDERACCVGEGPKCAAGLFEVPKPDAGLCPDALPGTQSSGVCRDVAACGGEGERACCLFEAPFGACRDGLVDVPLPGAGPCDISPGFLSDSVCAPKTPCGGKGQRACCAGEGANCAKGLVEVPGCSGDCTCGGGFASSGMCTVIEPIAEPEDGWKPPESTLASPLRGYADLHLHLFAHLAHGGGILAGKPYDAIGGINTALQQDYGTDIDLVKKDGGELASPTCPAFLKECGKRLFHGDHLLLGGDGIDQVGAATKDGGDRFLLGAESNLGAPIFNGWPTWNTTTHQQSYYAWMERAWRGGLRLAVVLAVTNEALCQTNKHLRGTDCTNGMASIDAQLNEAYRIEKFIDAISGGEGLGWFRIVQSPAEAREVIAKGKLAVVLGIEMDNLFNCKFDERDPTSGKCTEASIRALVDDYYARGVRHIFPVHNFDNAFGSPATWQDAIGVGNRGVEGRWWAAEDCPGEGYGFKLGDFPFDFLGTLMMNLFGFGELDLPPGHPGDASCNSLGLAPLGHTLMDALMRKGMIVDIDHMSARAIDDTLAIAESVFPPYPLVASHVQFFELNDESIRHERMRTREQLDRIRGVGGMVAAMLKDDVQDTDDIGRKRNVPYGKVPDDCRHSSKTWAQAYLYAADVMQGPVAFGSDFNGVAGHVGPRFGSDGCGGDPGVDLLVAERQARLEERAQQLREGHRLGYPFTIPGFGSFERQQTGHKTFDYNVDGLAHIGLLPDLVGDLGAIGLSETDLDPLFHSAEGYVEVWERALAAPEPDAVAGAAAALIALAALRRRARGDRGSRRLS